MPKPIRPRRAPWREDGKEVLLVTEPGGVMDRAVDKAERDIIANARSLLRITERMSDGIKTEAEFAFVVERLREALDDVLNVCDALRERS